MLGLADFTCPRRRQWALNSHHLSNTTNMLKLDESLDIGQRRMFEAAAEGA